VKVYVLLIFLGHFASIQAIISCWRCMFSWPMDC
jgi:hypothetical protein